VKINTINRMLQKFKDFPIKRKLLISYFLLIFIPLGFLTLISYRHVSKELENRILFSSGQAFEQAYSFINYKINSLVSASDLIYYNPDIQTILKRDFEEYKNDLIQQNEDMKLMAGYFDNFRKNEDIYRVSLYVPDGLMYSNQDVNFHNLNIFRQTDDFQKLISIRQKVIWLPPQTILELNGTETVVISILRQIRDLEQLNQTIGVVKISTNEKDIRDIIENSTTTHGGLVIIRNSAGDLISSSNKNRINNPEFTELLKLKGVDESGSWITRNLNGTDYLVYARLFFGTDWEMLSAIPYSEFLTPGYRIRNIMLLFMFGIGIISYITAYYITHSSTRRVNNLIANMHRVQSGNLDVFLPSESSDEIGELIVSFNSMIKQINYLVQQQYKAGREIKNAELKALQAQINPHFLYNTLDLINWKAIDKSVPEIVEITQALAKFYKLSLNQGKDVVTLRDEINHILTYIQIQNLRFDGKIDFNVVIPEDIYQYGILKLLLQPIVENAIVHGILPNRQNNSFGKIEISGLLSDEDLILEISDNGVGMSQEKINNLLNGSDLKSRNGYGIKNINDRIKLYYGEKYGLLYSSSISYGTTVIIRIPAIRIKG